MTEEHKIKIGLANRGKIRSTETRRKIGENSARFWLGKTRVFSFEHKKNISEAQKGRIPSEKTKFRMSESQKRIGNRPPLLLGHKFSKERNDKIAKANWKGEDVGYSGLHSWVRKELGVPEICEHCKREGLRGHSIHWANKSGEYQRNLADWLRLCVPCHSRYDNHIRN